MELVLLEFCGSNRIGPHAASALGARQNASPKIDAANANILLLVMTIPLWGIAPPQWAARVVETVKG
jgi:hypothetical protein